MNAEGSEKAGERDPTLDYLGRLDEETMTLAWGPVKSPEDRRRIVSAAVIFGRKFEERMRENPPDSLEERDFQRFLMGLMNAVISDFADREGLDAAAAAEFLGNVGTRDQILELNEVLEAFSENPELPLNDHLRTAVESRQDKAVWSRHFKSG